MTVKPLDRPITPEADSTEQASYFDVGTVTDAINAIDANSLSVQDWLKIVALQLASLYEVLNPFVGIEGELRCDDPDCQECNGEEVETGSGELSATD